MVIRHLIRIKDTFWIIGFKNWRDFEILWICELKKEEPSDNISYLKQRVTLCTGVLFGPVDLLLGREWVCDWRHLKKRMYEKEE